jgi:replication-associated recombination protein RarA
MSRWQDPRVATWKSATQKCIRRGEIDKAVWAASQLLAMPGGKTALARRLPMVAGEDVGGRWLPAVIAVTKEVMAIVPSPIQGFSR